MHSGYERIKTNYPGYHLERVPFSKILIAHINSYLPFRSGGKVPHPFSSEEPPRLIKHQDGLYTVYDGNKRVYWTFRDFCVRDKWPHTTTMTCLVNNLVDDKPSYGSFAWQIASSPFLIRTHFLKRIIHWFSGKSQFYVLDGEVRRVLSLSTQQLLSTVEDLLSSLYSDEKVRLYDLKAIANLEHYSGEGLMTQRKEEQMKRLHDYEIILKDLVGKDAAKEKKSISTLEKLLTAIEWELKNNLLIGKYRKQLQSLIVLLKGKNEQEKGLLFALKEQLTMINSGRVPHSEKIEEIILIEQNFLKEFKWWKE